MQIYKSSNLRKHRYSSQNCAYVVTSNTKDRDKSLSNLKNARLVITSFKFCELKNWSRTLSFVVMPDHFHCFFELGGEKSLIDVVGAVKRYTSRHSNNISWQSGFYDRLVRNEERYQNISRYIIMNPVRSGICSNIGDYPHWDAIWF